MKNNPNEMPYSNNENSAKEAVIAEYREHLRLLDEKKADISDRNPKVDDVLELLEASDRALNIIPKLTKIEGLERMAHNITDEVMGNERYIVKLILNLELEDKSSEELKTFLEISRRINSKPSLYNDVRKSLEKAIPILERSVSGKKIEEDIRSAWESPPTDKE